MSTVLPEDNESVPRNARSKLSDVPSNAPMDKMLAMSAAFPEDNKSVPPAPPTGASAPVAPPAPKPLARFKVILEEDAAIPPTGLFISANGRPYLLMAGVEAQVPQEVISVLNDAVIAVPVVDPQTQRVTGYRSRLRFPYRRIDGLSMQTGELLAELRHHVLRDVSDQVAGASDYLWSDNGLIRYINEGQTRFARQTKCIRDASTPAVCQFTTVSDQEFYTLDPHVISVLSVRMTGDKADMARAGHSDLDTYRQPDTYFFDPSQLSSMPPGKPVAWTTDEGVIQDAGGSYTAIQLRLYPVPLAPYTGIIGNMRVARLPLVPLSISQPDGVPEVPEEHHMDILNWAAYLALRGVDLDVAGGGAWDRAKEFRAAFDDAVSDMKKDAQSKMFKPLQWGFGRNGWSYEGY